IRASYGEVGSDLIGTNFLSSDNRFLYRPTAWLITGGSFFGQVGSNYNLLTGVREGRATNPNLTWERSVKTNLGVEMAFWNKNITLNVDVFDEQRDNILFNRPSISTIYGISLPPVNSGKMQNRGYELDFTLNHNIGKLNYQVKANYSFARNKILFQDEVPPVYSYQARTGQRNGQFFGLIAEGLYNTMEEINDPRRPVYAGQNNKVQPGDIKYRDVNKDGIIDGFDAVAIGYSQVPEKTYGVSLLGQYKGFTLSVLFQGVGNVSLPYSRRFNQAFFDQPTAGAVNYLIESWTQERYDAGLPIKFPRFSRGVNGGSPNNYEQSTFFLADASYLRIKNVEIGYSFSGRLLKKVGLSSTRVFVNANNLYTWDKVYPGVDPESPPTATNLEPYPLVRTINMGINLNF
ncbi:MAG TPA: TonB-dependent receptor, partial [Chitinophagaceae bacterium]|nr:TonB-dependent receptor [Chitinophagaceae bacterium]